MNCREFIDFLDGYFDGTLPESERVAFDRHLDECPHCREYLASYRATVRLEQAAFADDAPAAAPEDLIRAILAARPTR
jgi:anti-sigma factor RsiW